MRDVDNSAMMESFLRQKSQQVQNTECHDLVVAPSECSGGTLGHNMSLEDFKEYVRKYMEIDNWLKKAQTVMKEKKRSKISYLKS